MWHVCDMKNEIIRTRVNPDKRQEAENVSNELGITTGDAINLFLSQIVIQRGLPFPVTTQQHLSLDNATLEQIQQRYKERIPNTESEAALAEDLSHAKQYKSSDSVLKSLKS